MLDTDDGDMGDMHADQADGPVIRDSSALKVLVVLEQASASVSAEDEASLRAFPALGLHVGIDYARGVRLAAAPIVVAHGGVRLRRTPAFLFVYSIRTGTSWGH